MYSLLYFLNYIEHHKSLKDDEKHTGYKKYFNSKYFILYHSFLPLKKQIKKKKNNKKFINYKIIKNFLNFSNFSLLKIKTNWKIFRILQDRAWIKSLDIKKNTDWFVSGSVDRTIKLWKIFSEKPKFIYTGHAEEITHLELSQETPYLFSSSLDNTIKCWDLEKCKVIKNYFGHKSGVETFKIHHTLDVIASGGKDSSCRIWDIKTSSEIFSFTGHKGSVTSILTNEKEPFLITGSQDQTLKFWDLRSSKCLFSIYFENQSIKYLKKKNHSSFHLLLNNSIVNLHMNYINYSNITQKKVCNLEYHCFDISIQGNLIIGTESGELLQFNSSNLNFINKFLPPKQKKSLKNEKGISCLIFSSTGDMFLSGGCDKTIKLWVHY
uniref:mRNA splicing factor PRL1 n=1 Tax=Lotharella vacuolata TaxID=74820 RepID=A0A0H5BL16_9EUKA|nr:mRNA splicing factor PRL1 [Lotharella vacuolata]